MSIAWEEKKELWLSIRNYGKAIDWDHAPDYLAIVDLFLICCPNATYLEGRGMMMFVLESLNCPRDRIYPIISGLHWPCSDKTIERNSSYE